MFYRSDLWDILMMHFIFLRKDEKRWQGFGDTSLGEIQMLQEVQDIKLLEFMVSPPFVAMANGNALAFCWICM